MLPQSLPSMVPAAAAGLAGPSEAGGDRCPANAGGKLPAAAGDRVSVATGGAVAAGPAPAARQGAPFPVWLPRPPAGLLQPAPADSSLRG